MAQAEPVGIDLEVFVVDQDAAPTPSHCRDFAAPNHPADLLGAVRDDALLRDLIRRPEQSFHISLRTKESRLSGRRLTCVFAFEYPSCSGWPKTSQWRRPCSLHDVLDLSLRAEGHNVALTVAHHAHPGFGAAASASRHRLVAVTR